MLARRSLERLGPMSSSRPSKRLFEKPKRVAVTIAAGCLGAFTSHGVRAAGAAAILAAAAWRWPEVQTDRRRRSRNAEIVAALPDALDLMSACARGGASVAQAFAIVAERDQGPLGGAMRDALDALEHGLPRALAYDILCAGADVPEVRMVAGHLHRAEILGTSIAVALADLSREMREKRRALAEEQAHGTPVRMLFPIVVCFLPAFGLLTVVPILVVALRSFRSA